MDTTGKFDLRNLINTALKSASSLVIKVEDQQSQSKEKSSSVDTKQTKTKNESREKDSTGVKKSDQKKDSNKANSEVNISKDSTVATNAGGSRWFFGIALVVVAALLLWLLKPKKKS